MLFRLRVRALVFFLGALRGQNGQRFYLGLEFRGNVYISVHNAPCFPPESFNKNFVLFVTEGLFPMVDTGFHPVTKCVTKFLFVHFVLGVDKAKRALSTGFVTYPTCRTFERDSARLNTRCCP